MGGLSSDFALRLDQTSLRHSGGWPFLRLKIKGKSIQCATSGPSYEARHTLLTLTACGRVLQKLAVAQLGKKLLVF
jgi:hypothetical protein